MKRCSYMLQLFFSRNAEFRVMVMVRVMSV
jgi:hypothetical protein